MQKAFINVTTAGLLLVLAAGICGAEDKGDDTVSPLDQTVPVASGDEVPGTAIEAPDESDAGPDTESVNPGEPPPSKSDKELLSDEFQRYKQMESGGAFDEAETAAKRIVELSIRVYGPQSINTAKALTNLGIVQSKTQQYDAAEQNFSTAVDIVEDREDRLNAKLVNPLAGLGQAQYASGHPDLAEKTFQRAVHITQVNEGPHTMQQVPLLESLAESRLSLGEVDDARDAEDAIYSLTIRHFGDDSLDLVPSLMRRAAWQHRTGFYEEERATYRRVVHIIEDQSGKNDLSLIEPLTMLGDSFNYAPVAQPDPMVQAPVANGDTYLKRALRIAEDSPDSNWRILANAQIALADYYMFSPNQSKARSIYKESWGLLSANDERKDYRAKTLETVTLLRGDPIPDRAGETAGKGGPTNNMLVGKVVVAYAVSSRGSAYDINVVETQPPEFTDMQQTVTRELRNRIYRPRMVDGEPIATQEQSLTHNFYYLPSDLKTLQSANDGASKTQ